MNTIHIVLVLLTCIAEIFGGSQCPIRRRLYPCRCINFNLSKRKLHTTVVCNSLIDTNTLTRISQVLPTDIDIFHMYDSFWSADESQQVLPTDWMTLTNMKEVEIQDTTLSSCFACQWNMPCRNAVTTKFKIINSTSSDKICTVCDSARGARTPWLSCLSKLQHFQLSHGNLKSVTGDFFPYTLRELTTLDLSYNQIGKVDGNAFKYLPKLKNLDLSYNLIEHIDHTFGNKTELEYIDLSHNLMKMIGPDLISQVPKIKSLNFAFNKLNDFRYSDWRMAPASLRKIDLTGNSIRCDCNLKWVNSTFAVHVSIIGTCSTPQDYENSHLRAVSRYMIERCDANGRVGERKKNN